MLRLRKTIVITMVAMGILCGLRATFLYLKLRGQEVKNITTTSSLEERQLKVGPKQEPIAKNIPKVRGAPLELKLLGTMNYNNAQGQAAMAIIEDLETKRFGAYKLDDLIKGARLVKILRGCAVLLRDGKEEILFLSDGTGQGTALASEPVIAISSTEFIINKANLRAQGISLNDIAQEVTLVPEIESGKLKAFKLDNIRRHSLLEKAGLSNGDMLMAVNGEGINSINKALEMLQKVRSEAKIKVDVERAGQTVSMTYWMR